MLKRKPGDGNSGHKPNSYKNSDRPSPGNFFDNENQAAI
jgi:hypothetical protein